MKNNSSINGNNNAVNQAENIFNVYSYANLEAYQPDEYASKLLKETIEDENNPTIIHNVTCAGHTIQCGSCKLSISSSNITKREMTYWEDALKKLEEYDYIRNLGFKNQVYEITRKGYDYYDKYINIKK